MVAAGALLGAVIGQAHGIRPEFAAIVGSLPPSVFDIILRSRRTGHTPYGRMMDPKFGGMLYYVPVWMLGAIAVTIATVALFIR